MGCATSQQLDDSPAVALCRDRCALLDNALRRRSDFARSHAAYLLSLKSVGPSLHSFFFISHDQHVDHLRTRNLNLLPRRKGDVSPDPDHHLQSHSSTDSNSESPLHRGDAQRDQPYGGYTPNYGSLINLNDIHEGDAAGFLNMSYMKNQTSPSVVHTQQPMVPETMYADEFSASSSWHNADPHSAKNNNQNLQNPTLYSNHNLNNNDSSYPNYGAGDEFGGGSSPPAPYSGPSDLNVPPPPPPPPPPRGTTWDFLNPFDSAVESYYPTYTQYNDSKEVRETEGIPDLEDEDEVVVKEIHGDQRFVGGGRSGIHSKPVAQEDVLVAKHEERPGPGARMESNLAEHEVHVANKNANATRERLKDRGNASGFKTRSATTGELEVVTEIQLQFQRASDSGSELAKFLEVGKFPYDRKHSNNQVSSKLLYLASSLPLLSRATGNVEPSIVDENAELRSINQSFTLHKLYLWEKKLYEEVKIEEKMRVLHEAKSKKLKHLDERGAEAPKVDATRNLVRSLSTKIKIAMQVVDKISVKINNLRDEELWPQLHELIEGLTRMWKSMLECHRNQCRAIGEAKRLDAIASRKHFGDAHFEATRQLEHDLIDWTLGFSCWITAQKDYVRSLNNWLMKCLLYVPEETPDGLAPFSPGRIGAPPVFVVCNQWSKSLDSISETEVINSMRDLASNVLLLWDREKAEVRQRMLASKEERKIKSLEKEDQKIQKQIRALDKRIKVLMVSAVDNGMPLTGHTGYQRETTEGGSLQASLRHVLEALETYAANSLKVYEELLQHMEEDRLARAHEKVSI